MLRQSRSSCLKIHQPIRSLVIIDNFSTTLRYTAFGAIYCRPWCVSRRICDSVEVISDSILTVDAAVRLETTRIEITEFCSIGGSFRARDLRTADEIVNNRRHGKAAFAKEDLLFRLKRRTTYPAPSLLIEIFKIIFSETIGTCKSVSEITRMDHHTSTGSSCLGLGFEIEHITSGASQMLTPFQ